MSRPPSQRGKAGRVTVIPLGDEAFLDAISRRLNRVVTPGKRGRKPKRNVAAAESKG
jgi:hypothetical protein